MSDWPIRMMVYGAGEAINGANALAPPIQAQISSLLQIATNPFIAAVVQLDSSSVPTQRYVLDPLGRQPINYVPDVNTGDPSELIDFVRWSAAVCPAKRSVLVLSGHGAAWQDGMVDEILGTADAALTRRTLAPAPSVVDLGGVTGPGSPPPRSTLFTRTAGVRQAAVPPEGPAPIRHARRLFGPDVSPAGSATRAVLIDGDSRDYLSNAELGAACDAISELLGSKIDVLVFDACLMSAWEILEELSSSVSTVVGSIDELSAAGIDLAGPASKLTAASGAGDAAMIAATITGGFQPQAAFDSCIAIDLANPNWTEALENFRAFCTVLLPWIQLSSSNADAVRSALRYAATSVVKFKSGGLADIDTLATAIANVPAVPEEATANIEAAAAAIRTCVLGRSTGSDYRAANGISIFSPNSVTVYETNRPQYVRLRFPSVSGWSAVLDAIYGFQSSHTRFLTPTAPSDGGDGGSDAEFVVSLRGFSISADQRDRIEKAINRAVLDVLASIDLLNDVSLMPPSQFAKTRRLGLSDGLGSTAGLVVTPNQDLLMDTRGLAASERRSVSPGPTVVQSSGSEFRVILRGLKLDQPTKERIDASIRSAVLQVVASIDHGLELQVGSLTADPQTRSLLGDIGTAILGFILRPTWEV